MGFNCLKASATSRRQFTFYHQVPSATVTSRLKSEQKEKEK